MEQSTLALIILAVTLVLYCIPAVPLAVTTMLAMLAMAATGIITFSEAYSGFANSAIFLMAGMMIIGRAWFTTGLAGRISRVLYRFVGSNEKLLIAVILVVASFISVFLNGSLTVAILMPVIDSLVVRSGGRITRKQTYFPLGVASVLGNNLTTISATSMVTAGALLSEAGFRQLGLFEPTAVNLPALLVVIVFYILAGHKLQSRWFDFEEIPPAPEQELSEDALSGVPIWKTWLTLAVTLAVVVLLVCGADTGFAALIGACVLVLTRCVSEREAFASISWQVIIIAAGAIGFSKGMDASGAGAIIASTVIGLFGDGSPFVICIALFVIGSLLSNFMSDNASVAVLIPITLAVAQGMNCDATPLVLSAASGIKVALATPISVTPMTMIGVPGYRFKDYLRMGGLVNLISLAVTGAAIYVIYFM